MAFNQPLTLKYSCFLASFFLVIHVGAMIISYLTLVWYIASPFTILVIVSLMFNLNRYALLLSRKSIIKLWFKNKEEWLLQNRQGEVFAAKLLPGSFRSLHVVILNFKLIDGKNKLSVIILPDSLTKVSFRRLRAQLA